MVNMLEPFSVEIMMQFSRCSSYYLSICPHPSLQLFDHIVLNSHILLTEYCKDLPTYLQFCKDVVFAGSKPSLNDEKEEELIESLWEFYQSGKVMYSLTSVAILSSQTH